MLRQSRFRPIPYTTDSSSLLEYVYLIKSLLRQQESMPDQYYGPDDSLSKTYFANAIPVGPAPMMPIRRILEGTVYDPIY
jgi:hypothetical protein